ncbi:P-loop containing nucleoside triphosphate hydrolase protein [Panaeolus papilionaceus]|nr:P-loop containing nucleoside triphosphate hydrolase protein [Panaeolus papilionaceus]
MVAEIFHKKDVLVSAGTGSGKTLPVALAVLLQDPDDHRITITVSPLKRLQSTQANEFIKRYGIQTVVVNDTTSREDSLTSGGTFQAHVFGNTKKNNLGKTAQIIISTVEQLFRSPEGHFSNLAEGLREKKHFQRRISRICKAFRPAWGSLDQLKIILPSNVRWLAFSATLPDYVCKVVKTKILNSDHVSIKMTSNRPNTIYATHQVVKGIDHLPNYQCFLAKPFSLESQPHVIIFVDDKSLAQNIAVYLNTCLPTPIQKVGVVRHYHSTMSEEYLQAAHDAFTSPDGNCRILVSTSGQSVGVDFPNVKIVCSVGIPTTIIDALQRAGRAIRTSDDQALFVVFYDSWALSIEESEFTYGDKSNPDRPRKELKSKPNQRDRVPLSGIKLINSKTCLRRFFAEYLDDTADNALETRNDYCCDRCPHRTDSSCRFNLQNYIPGHLLTSEKHHGLDINIQTQQDFAEKPTKVKYRSVPHRIALEHEIIHKRESLVKLPAGSITTVSGLAQLVDEDDEWAREWGERILSVLVSFDQTFPGPVAKKGPQSKK